MRSDITRAPMLIRRMLRSTREPLHQTVATDGPAGHVAGEGASFGITNAADSVLDFRALTTRGYWTEDHGWSVRCMRIASGGQLDE
jgi:hypothetical protein